MTARFAAIAFLTTGIRGTTAPTAEQRWMGVKSVRLTEIFNICDTCVYAPCLCGNEPENCVAYIERIGSSMYTEVQNEN